MIQRRIILGGETGEVPGQSRGRMENAIPGQVYIQSSISIRFLSELFLGSPRQAMGRQTSVILAPLH